jgi:hypothetical protein
MSHYSDLYDGPEPPYQKQQNKKKVMNVEKGVPYKAEVVNVTGDGTYTDKNDVIQYKNLYTLKIDDSELFLTVASDKSPTPEFKKGDKVIATVNWMNERGQLGSLRSESDKGSYKKSSGWQPKTTKDIVREQMAKNTSMALAYATQYHQANGVTSGAVHPSPEIHAMAEANLDWLNTKTLELLDEERLK